MLTPECRPAMDASVKTQLLQLLRKISAYSYFLRMRLFHPAEFRRQREAEAELLRHVLESLSKK